MLFELSCKDYANKNSLDTTLSVSFEKQNLHQVVKRIEYFLRACGYEFDSLKCSLQVKEDSEFMCDKIDFDSNSHVI
jgi:hypothetical protein